MPEQYVNISKVKNYVSGANLQIDNQAIIITNGRVEELLAEAAGRAKANRRKTIMPYDVSGPQESETYVVSSKVRAFASRSGLRISSVAVIIVNGRVGDLLRKAAERARANGRRTIMPYDI